MSESSGRALTFLWFIDLDFSTRLHHGGTLRYFNYSRELVALGHRVYFVVQFQPGEAEAGREFFSELKEQETFTDFFDCTYTYRRWKGRIAALALPPPLTNRWLARNQLPALKASQELASKLDADICIFSNRRFFFLVPWFAKILPSVIDFGDCMTLYRFREARFLWQNRDFRKLVTCLRYLTESYLQECYYGRLSHANIVVSPVDKNALDKITTRPERTQVLLNGVSIPECSTNLKKVSGRLIFSGNMNFPPNYHAAIWFIDDILPLIRKAHPQAHLVVAGANPVPELLERAGDYIRVTGYVKDMNAEIAASSLYVAPLITGGGFKNKVVEALANRTYVAATSMALEFFDSGTVGKILVGDSVTALANRIIDFISDPEQFEERLADLHSMVLREFTWRNRTEQLLSVVGTARFHCS